MSIRSFRDLRVYESAVELRRGVFEVSKRWPKEERYALTDQVRRSSRAVGANLAEAWSKRRCPKRRCPKHFVAKLTDAHGEAEETGVWLDTALECGYLRPARHADLTKAARAAAGGIAAMIRQPSQWAGTPSSVREADVPYDLDVADDSAPPS